MIMQDPKYYIQIQYHENPWNNMKQQYRRLIPDKRD